MSTKESVWGSLNIGDVIKSFRVTDTVANLRTLADEILLSGVIMLIDYLGVGAAFFEWDEASVLADDGINVVKPDSIDIADPGRWILIGVQVSSIPGNLNLSGRLVVNVADDGATQFQVRRLTDGAIAKIQSTSDFASLMLGAATNFGSNNNEENKWSLNWRGRPTGANHKLQIRDELNAKNVITIHNSGIGIFKDPPTLPFEFSSDGGGQGNIGSVGSNSVIGRMGVSHLGNGTFYIDAIATAGPSAAAFEVRNNGATALTVESTGIVRVATGMAIGPSAGTPAQGVVRISRSANPTLVFETAGAEDAQVRVMAADTLSVTTDGSTAEQFRVGHVAGAVNWVNVNGRTTGGLPIVGANGADAAVGLGYAAKGAAGHQFFTETSWSALSAPVTASEQFRVGHTAGAVNLIRVAGGAAANAAKLDVIGTDTNIELFIGSKGTGAIRFLTNGALTEQARVSHVASAVNYGHIQGGAAGNPPQIIAAGEATVGVIYGTTGTGDIQFFTGGSEQVRITRIASAVNFAQLHGGSTGNGATLEVAGTDTNIALNLVTKGSGNLLLQPNTGDVRWGKALVALGGGAAPTFGTIGGSGPATAAQNSWMRLQDSAGNAMWVPVWK